MKHAFVSAWAYAPDASHPWRERLVGRRGAVQYDSVMLRERPAKNAFVLQIIARSRLTARLEQYKISKYGTPT